MKRVRLLAVCAALALSGCASSYGTENLTGGYSEKPVSDTVWRVRFGGNGYTSAETVQTYWLYHCAEFTLSKGYDGFRLVTAVPLTENGLQSRWGEARLIKAHSGGGGGGGHVYTYSYGYAGGLVDKPWLQGDIELLKKPFTPVPGRSFEAAPLKALLEPYVTGPKCGGNVCPHVHSYLYTAP